MKIECGVAAVIFDKQYNVLLQHRGKEPGLGKMVLPGGRVDESDGTIESALCRELREELGLVLTVYNLTKISFGMNYDTGEEPCLMLYFLAFAESHEVHNREPRKCFGLKWWPMPSNMSSLPLDMWSLDAQAIFAARQHLTLLNAIQR